MTDHPLTEDRAAELWDAARDPKDPSVVHSVSVERGAHDAGREHERTNPADATAVTNEMIEAGASHAWERANPGILGWNSLSEDRKEGCRRDARAVLTAALAVAAPADDRPWEPLNGRPVHVGYEVRHDRQGLTTTAVVGWVDGRGDPWAAEGGFIGARDWGTWYVRPAPAPPAEEVELPGEHPAHLTDVEDVEGDVCAYMALDNDGDWCGVDQDGVFCDWRPNNLTAFTLPDGTRARRDGERANGEPRFVEVGE